MRDRSLPLLQAPTAVSVPQNTTAFERWREKAGELLASASPTTAS